METKKDLRKSISYLQDYVNRIEKRVARIEDASKVAIGEGKQSVGLYPDIVYTEIPVADIVKAILKHLNLSIIERENESKFYLNPLKGKGERKDGD